MQKALLSKTVTVKLLQVKPVFIFFQSVKIEFQQVGSYSVDEVSADSNDVCEQSSSSEEDSEPQAELPIPYVKPQITLAIPLESKRT